MDGKSKAELKKAHYFVCILHDSYYGSDGEEALKLAIALRKPVIMWRPGGRNVPIPQEFEDYQGIKKITATAAETATMIKLLTPDGEVVWNYYDHDYTAPPKEGLQ